jgi:hypothetical protein
VDQGRVARLFLVEHSKMGKIFEITIKYTKWPLNIPNRRKTYKMAIK